MSKIFSVKGTTNQTVQNTIGAFIDTNGTFTPAPTVTVADILFNITKVNVSTLFNTTTAQVIDVWSADTAGGGGANIELNAPGVGTGSTNQPIMIFDSQGLTSAANPIIVTSSNVAKPNIAGNSEYRMIRPYEAAIFFPVLTSGNPSTSSYSVVGQGGDTRCFKSINVPAAPQLPVVVNTSVPINFGADSGVATDFVSWNSAANLFTFHQYATIEVFTNFAVARGAVAGDEVLALNILFNGSYAPPLPNNLLDAESVLQRSDGDRDTVPLATRLEVKPTDILQFEMTCTAAVAAIDIGLYSAITAPTAPDAPAAYAKIVKLR